MVVHYAIHPKKAENSSGLDLREIALIGPAKGAYHHILKNRHSGGDLHELKGPADAFAVGHEGFEPGDLFPLEDHLSRGGLMVAYNAVEQRCLPGAIRTDETDNFSLMNLKGDAVIGHHTTKVFDEIDHFEECHG